MTGNCNSIGKALDRVGVLHAVPWVNCIMWGLCTWASELRSISDESAYENNNQNDQNNFLDFLIETSLSWTQDHGVVECLFRIARLSDRGFVDIDLLGSPVIAISFSSKENVSTLRSRGGL